MVRDRIKDAKTPNEEALFLIDTFMAASFFCTGVIEKRIDTKSAMNRMFARAERVRAELEKSKRSSNGNNGGTPLHGIDGNPLIIPG